MNRQSLAGSALKQFLMGQFGAGVGGAVGAEAATGEAVAGEAATQAAPSGWDFAASMGKAFANSAVPGIFNEQGVFDPANAIEQNTYGPYFGQNGIFNVTKNGPWRR